MMLSQGRDVVGNEHEVEEEKNGEDGDHDMDVNSATEMIYKISSSGMFALDRGPDIADMEKLQYVCDALGQDAFHDQMGGSMWKGSAEVRHGQASKPYILVSRGEEFADSFDARFFAKTFPTLFLIGNGGTRQAEESITDLAEGAEVALEVEAMAWSLVSSRNMSLERWAYLVLQ